MHQPDVSPSLRFLFESHESLHDHAIDERRLARVDLARSYQHARARAEALEALFRRYRADVSWREVAAEVARLAGAAPTSVVGFLGASSDRQTRRVSTPGLRHGCSQGGFWARALDAGVLF